MRVHGQAVRSFSCFAVNLCERRVWVGNLFAGVPEPQVHHELARLWQAHPILRQREIPIALDGDQMVACEGWTVVPAS